MEQQNWELMGAVFKAEAEDLRAENKIIRKQLSIAIKALDGLRGVCDPTAADKAYNKIMELAK